MWQDGAYGWWGLAVVLFGFWVHRLMKVKSTHIPFVPSTGEGVHTSAVQRGTTVHILEVKGNAATQSAVVAGTLRRQQVRTEEGDIKFIEP